MYKKVLVPLDGSKLAECVLPHVEAIGKGCNVVETVLVRVVEPLHLYRGEEHHIVPEERERLDEDSMAVARDYLETIKKQLESRGLGVTCEVLFGRVAEKLADYAEKNDFDLIVIASHGRSGVSRWVWGSVADRILRAACVPVLMVRAPGCEPRSLL